MAFGDCNDDADLRAAWKDFCGKLEAAGEGIFKDHNPANGLQRADALRFLTQNLGQAFDLALETKNTKFPVIHEFCTPFCKLGGDNADYTYQQAWIDGESVYRITGNRGTARFFNIAVQGPRPEHPPGRRGLHDPFGDTPEANLLAQDMEIGWDGSFEVYIGGPERGSNWLPTTPGSRKLFIRQGFDDWSELPAQMRIERVGMAEPRPMPDPAEMIAATQWAGTFVEELMQDWPDWSYEFSENVDIERPNRFPSERRDLDDPVYNEALDAVRGRAIDNMCWKLAPDEALVITFDATDTFWMLTNMGVFMSSMDYLYRPVSYTPARSTTDSDGKVRMVLAHSDPGFHNWIDTQGFERGNITARNNFVTDGLVFNTQLVKHAEIADHMPEDSARVTPDERSEQLRARFHSVTRRYLI
ncbi:MAG: DUF1214 domain-containing protein [Novosphingobium sp.]|nr:DUF1214 domain-containing protein [Novosphingobium sp.]